MKICALIPTYDNPATIERVVREALNQSLDVVVIDDGSAKAAAQILDAIDGITLLRHERNRGKGCALLTGLRHAGQHGYSHAISMDGDGQHLASDLALFVQAARRHPDALILGRRDLTAAGASRSSRFGNAFSNFWTWVETGERIADTQTGYRCYPLASTSALHFDTVGYDFEIEVLVKLAWCGVPIRSVAIAVRYFQGAERVSHLRPVVDFLRIGRLNTRLVTQLICFPPALRRAQCLARERGLPLARRLERCLVAPFAAAARPAPRVAALAALGFLLGLVPGLTWAPAARRALARTAPLVLHASRWIAPVLALATPFLALAIARAGESTAGAWLASFAALLTAGASLGAVATWILVLRTRGRDAGLPAS